MNIFFISGSRRIKELPDKALELIRKSFLKGEVIVGDCDGVDKLVMDVYDNTPAWDSGNGIGVYYTTDCRDSILITPRNVPESKGYTLHPTPCSSSIARYSREWYKAKDVRMSAVCTKAFIFVKNNSRGSIENYRRLIELKKEVFIYNIK